MIRVINKKTSNIIDICLRIEIISISNLIFVNAYDYYVS